MMTETNRDIYNTYYTAENLRLDPGTDYDRQMIELRLSLVERLGRGGDVLDLCCGTGSYLLPLAGCFRRSVALDFSRRMLEGLARQIEDKPVNPPLMVEADAASLPLRTSRFDLVYSFSSLYYILDLPRVIQEVERVLRPGGHAVLELGNSRSLNALASRAFAAQSGWARPHLFPYPSLRRMVRHVGVEIVEWRCFQIFPLYGAPRRLLLLAPLLSARWKGVMGRPQGGRMLDERLSSAWPVRHLAFRHLVVLRKP